MPFVINDGCRLYWHREGSDAKPALLLLNPIGSDLTCWERVLGRLAEVFCVVRMDSRGHGASDVTPGDYRLEQLANDARAVLDAASIDQAIVCGISLGSSIAVTLAARSPERVRALILVPGAAELEAGCWEHRRASVLQEGMASVASAVTEDVEQGFARRHPMRVETLRQTLLATDPQGYAGCCAALRDTLPLDLLSLLAAPALVIRTTEAGAMQRVSRREPTVAAITGAVTRMFDTGHSPHIEAPSAFTGAVIGFANSINGGNEVEAARGVIYQAGMKTRREVLGTDVVDRRMAGVNDFNADYFELVTRYAWQELWSRPGLDHRTRRLLVLAITASMGRWEEFRLHLEIGLEQGGFTQDEVKETLLQIGVYAGLPAANTGFSEAAAVLSAWKKNNAR
ncbi:MULTISPECIES: alpha/beta fold hydrolase [Pseudomonas]|uniref:alpha/beta fold hydrolase n=1 Tax=Pseudomonas TaxID=286 RepID=UPI00398F9FBC